MDGAAAPRASRVQFAENISTQQISGSASTRKSGVGSKNLGVGGGRLSTVGGENAKPQPRRSSNWGTGSKSGKTSQARNWVRWGNYCDNLCEIKAQGRVAR